MSNKKPKEQVQIEQQAIHLIANIVELYPQYTFVQHLCHILRKKGGEEAYYWKEQQFLKKIEDYYDEIRKELATEEYA